MAKIHGVNVMKLKKPTINFRKLRKHSQIYRKAAELLQYDLERGIGIIYGCCSAFSEIESMAWDKILDLPANTPARDKVRSATIQLGDLLDDAQAEFKEMYRPKSRPLYWFGNNFDRTEQEHRITALLLMADIAESEGN